MYLLFSSPLGILDHFYPLVKGWVSGMNILLAALEPITPVGSVEDGNSTKGGGGGFCSFSCMFQSVCLSIL